DTTISDFVADLRAATPTSAAELAVPNFLDVQQQIDRYVHRIQRALLSTIQQKEHQIRQLDQSYLFRFPDQLTRQKEQHVDQLDMRMKHEAQNALHRSKRVFSNLLQQLNKVHPEVQLKDHLFHFKQTMKQLESSMKQRVEHEERTFTSLLDKLMLLNPLEVMKRGFAIPYDHNNTFVTSVQQMHPDDDVFVDVQDGTLHCVVKQVEEKKHV